MPKYRMENFKEWLAADEMALGPVVKAAGNVAADIAFGPETGVSGQQATHYAGGAMDAARYAAYRAKQIILRKRCQFGNAQACMTGCSDYHDQECCNKLTKFRNVM